MTDLFTSHFSKKEQLLLWIKEKEFVKTSEVIFWGTQNWCNRAERNARQLAEEGKIVRLSDEEKTFRGYGNSKEDVWRFLND